MTTRTTDYRIYKSNKLIRVRNNPLSTKEQPVYSIDENKPSETTSVHSFVSPSSHSSLSSSSSSICLSSEANKLSQNETIKLDQANTSHILLQNGIVKSECEKEPKSSGDISLLSNRKIDKEDGKAASNSIPHSLHSKLQNSQKSLHQKQVQNSFVLTKKKFETLQQVHLNMQLNKLQSDINSLISAFRDKINSFKTDFAMQDEKTKTASLPISAKSNEIPDNDENDDDTEYAPKCQHKIEIDLALFYQYLNEQK